MNRDLLKIIILLGLATVYLTNRKLHFNSDELDQFVPTPYTPPPFEYGRFELNDNSPAIKPTAKDLGSGFNLVTYRPDSKASLVDVDGNNLYQWHAPPYLQGTWHHSVLTSDGFLAVIIKDRYLALLDSDSTLQWVRRMHVHHDLVEFDSQLYALSRQEGPVFQNGRLQVVLTDQINILNMDGSSAGKIDIVDQLGGVSAILGLRPKKLKDDTGKVLSWSFSSLLNTFPTLVTKTGGKFDLLHTNSIDVLKKKSSKFKRGSILLSLAALDEIVVLEAKTQNLVWRFGKGILDSQHSASFMKNGHILVFNNGTKRGFSTIEEIDPITDQIVRSYGHSNQQRFYSSHRGGVQELSNGNWLITSSHEARMFEINQSDEIVWEFKGRVDKWRQKKWRPIVFKMIRTPKIKPAKMN